MSGRCDDSEAPATSLVIAPGQEEPRIPRKGFRMPAFGDEDSKQSLPHQLRAFPPSASLMKC